MRSNVGEQFSRVPATDADRAVEGRPTRNEVLSFWEDRYGIPPGVFEAHRFWEKGSGKLWAFSGDAPEGTEVEALGITFLRVRQEHWKPTTDAVQRFGRHATQNVITVDAETARRFIAGEDQPVDWDGEWGYLIVAHELADVREPIGVGLYLHGELRSQIPKGRQRSV